VGTLHRRVCPLSLGSILGGDWNGNGRFGFLGEQIG
jgi:hypothetical protein